MKNILFLLVDCLRGDYVNGPSRVARTPVMARLCADGTQFAEAIATTTTTTPSVASLLTATYPFVHGVRSLHGYKLDPRCHTFPEMLQAHGYRTFAMVTGPLVSAVGLDRGFDHYLYRPKESHLYAAWGAELLGWLEGARAHEPWFLFLHLFELHWPRWLRPEFDSPQYGQSRYERALSCLDETLGKIMERVDLGQTLVVLHGDHGEAIEPRSGWRDRIPRPVRRAARKVFAAWGRRGAGRPSRATLRKVGHGFHVYEPLVRVPLVFVGGGVFPPGKIIEGQVRQIDIFPTVMEVVGLPMAPDPLRFGRSLLPRVRGESLPELPAYIEACGVTRGDEKEWLVGIRTSEWKYVYAPHNRDLPRELYDLKADPGERRNAAADRPDLVEKLHRMLDELRKVSPAPEPLAERMSAAEEEEIERRLRALGYIE